MCKDRDPVVTVTMATGGQFSFELWPGCAPNAAKSLIRLVQAGAYDGMTIDRIVPGYVIQPCYSDEGRPDLDIVLDGEFRENGSDGGRDFEPGVIGMGGDGKHLSSGSCFFIALGQCERLNGKFTAVGKIVSGWDEVRRLEQVPTRPVDVGAPGVAVNQPVVPEIMETVTVETFGLKYGPPSILQSE